LLGWFAGDLCLNASLRLRFQVTREATAACRRETEGPAIFSYDRSAANEPRYRSLPNIMKAKNNRFDDTSASIYGVDITAASRSAEDHGTPGPQGRVQGQDVAESDLATQTDGVSE